MTDNMVSILARATRTKNMSIIFFIRRYFNFVINKRMIFLANRKFMGCYNIKISFRLWEKYK